MFMQSPAHQNIKPFEKEFSIKLQIIMTWKPNEIWSLYK